MRKILFVLFTLLCVNLSAMQVDTVKNVVNYKGETFKIIKKHNPYNEKEKVFIIKDSKGNFGYFYIVSFFDEKRMYLDIRNLSVVYPSGEGDGLLNR